MNNRRPSHSEAYERFRRTSKDESHSVPERRGNGAATREAGRLQGTGARRRAPGRRRGTGRAAAAAASISAPVWSAGPQAQSRSAGLGDQAC